MEPRPEVAENATTTSPSVSDNLLSTCSSGTYYTTPAESTVPEHRLVPVTVPTYTAQGTPLLRQAVRGQNAQPAKRITHSTATTTTATIQSGKTAELTTRQTHSTPGTTMTATPSGHCECGFEKFQEAACPQTDHCFSAREENEKRENDKCQSPTVSTTAYFDTVPPGCGIPATEVPSAPVYPQYPETNSKVESASVVDNENAYGCKNLSAVYDELLKPIPKNHYDPRFSVNHQTTQPSYEGHSHIPTGYTTQAPSECRSVVRCPALVPSTMYQDIPPAPATIQNEVETLARNISRMYLESGTFPAKFFDLLPQRETKYMVNIQKLGKKGVCIRGKGSSSRDWTDSPRTRKAGSMHPT